MFSPTKMFVSPFVFKSGLLCIEERVTHVSSLYFGPPPLARSRRLLSWLGPISRDNRAVTMPIAQSDDKCLARSASGPVRWDPFLATKSYGRQPARAVSVRGAVRVYAPK